jgi:hypothetical protein
MARLTVGGLLLAALALTVAAAPGPSTKPACHLLEDGEDLPGSTPEDESAVTTVPGTTTYTDAASSTFTEEAVSAGHRTTVAATTLYTEEDVSAGHRTTAAATTGSTKKGAGAGGRTTASPTVSSTAEVDGNATTTKKTSTSQSLPSTDPGDTTPRKASWRDHPLYRSSPDAVTVPILAWYTTRSSEEYEWSLFSIGRYTLQGARYNLLAADVADTPEAKKLHNYDLLQLGTWGYKGIDNWLDFETTRDSQVCIVMGVDDTGADMGRDFKMAGPPGFEGVGMVQWDEESPKPVNMKYADYTGEPISWAYVACKTLPAGVHSMPSVDKIGAEYSLWGYQLIFSEVDGGVPPLSDMPPGWSGPDIVQHELCPEELHKMWVVDGHDPNDPDIAGVKWQTWHPQVDYIYRCYYGHEHGTPGILAGYTERFHYTAWKNENQDEPHEGFQTYVVPVGEHYFVYNLHAGTRDFSRIEIEHHSVVVAVTDKTTGKNLFEMSCKASSGGAAADYEEKSRPKEGPPVLPMGSAATQKLITDVYAVENYFERVDRRKRINLYDPDNLDPRLRYEGDTEEEHARGVYERWGMRLLGEICMNASEPYVQAGPVVDIKNSHNGCKDVACKTKVILGSPPDKYRDYFSPNLGFNRELVLRGISVGPQYCDHALPEPNADGYHVFYTDPYCGKLCDGPGKNCVMQKIHSSFKGLTVNQHYEVSDMHGHNTYEIAHPDGIDAFESEKGGLNGVRQVEGALGINVEEP